MKYLILRGDSETRPIQRREMPIDMHLKYCRRYIG